MLLITAAERATVNTCVVQSPPLWLTVAGHTALLLSPQLAPTLPSLCNVARHQCDCAGAHRGRRSREAAGSAGGMHCKSMLKSRLGWRAGDERPKGGQAGGLGQNAIKQEHNQVHWTDTWRHSGLPRRRRARPAARCCRRCCRTQPLALGFVLLPVRSHAGPAAVAHGAAAGAALEAGGGAAAWGSADALWRGGELRGSQGPRMGWGRGGSPHRRRPVRCSSSASAGRARAGLSQLAHRLHTARAHGAGNLRHAEQPLED